MQAEESQHGPIIFTRLQMGEVVRLAVIDRSEHITRVYRVEE
jgi:hypothetical protein